MKSVGEAMGIGRTFSEAFLKAFGSRELDPGSPTPWATIDDLPEGVHPWFVRAARGARSASCARATSAARSGPAGATTRSALRGGRPARTCAARRYARGHQAGSYRRVDSCGGEVEAASNYYYSTWGEEDEGAAAQGRSRAS